MRKVQIAFYVLAATAAVGAVIAALMIESQSPGTEREPQVAGATLEPERAS